MLRVVCPRPALLSLVALAAAITACGGRVTGDEHVVTEPFPPVSRFGPEKGTTSAPLPTPTKTPTSGRIDTSFGVAGSMTVPDTGAVPVCLVVSTRGEIWAASRHADVDNDVPRSLVQIDARGSLDDRVAVIPADPRPGFLAKLVGLEGCAQTDEGDLVVVHRGGQLGAEEIPVGPGLAYASRLVATSPEVTFETVALPFPALAVETEQDGTYVVAADKADGISELSIARVRRDGLVLAPVATPAVRHFHVRRLLRDGRSVLVAGMVDGANAYPNAMVGRLTDNVVEWTYPGLADMGTSLASKDRFGLAMDDMGHAYVVVGPGLSVARFTEHSAPLALDPTFAGDGTTQVSRDGIAWDALGVAGARLVVATSTGLVRVTSEGALDTTYGEGGRARIRSSADKPLRVTRAADGGVLVAGVSTAGALEITRYTP